MKHLWAAASGFTTSTCVLLLLVISSTFEREVSVKFSVLFLNRKWTFRRIHSQMFYKEGLFEKTSKIPRKQPLLGSLLSKFADMNIFLEITWSNRLEVFFKN